MDDRDRLAHLPWFAALEPAARGELIARGRWRRTAAGEWLHGEGDEETGLVAVLRGALHLHAKAPGGRDVLFGVLPEGGIMGQSVVFGGGPRLVTAIGAVDSHLFLLSDRVLRQAAERHPTLWPSLSALVYGQLRTTLRSLAEFVALKPRERMIARLLTLSGFMESIPLSQTALAEIVGASRNAVHGWLGELERCGVLARGYGVVRILDRPALRRLLAEEPQPA
jgi:CRP-like cAMP-binding protein